MGLVAMATIKRFTKKSKIKGKDFTFLLLSGALPATLFGTEIKQEQILNLLAAWTI